MVDIDLFRISGYRKTYPIKDLLSWKDGSDILIVFTNGLRLEYDKISDPYTFIKELLHKYKICDEKENTDIIKEKILEVNIRRHNLWKYYDEIWNNKSSNELPYNKSLIRFNSNIYNQYITFFSKNKFFTKKYLSTNYNFEYNFINEYWEYLDLGDAHYTAFISDTDGIYSPKFGLSFNKNIRWNSKLRAKYDYGLLNPFDGEYIGTKNYHTPISEIDFMDIMIPLSLHEEIERREDARSQFYYCYPEMEDFNQECEHMQFMNNIFEEYQFLDFNEFEKIFNESNLKVLVNESIWKNTLKYILDQDFVYSFFNSIKDEENKK